jgi:hypothetical protein
VVAKVFPEINRCGRRAPGLGRRHLDSELARARLEESLVHLSQLYSMAKLYFRWLPFFLLL